MYRDERLYGCPRMYLERPEDYWMLFPQDLLKSVVFIGQRTAQGEQWGGTGFFVSLRVPQDPTTAHVLLVTADHCVRDRTNLIMRVNGPNGAQVINLPPDLPDPKLSTARKWFRHPGLPPDEDESDIAVTLMSRANADWLYDVAHCSWIPAGNFLPDELMSDSWGEGVGIGDEVVALGLLRVHAGVDRNATIVRTGNLAMLGHESVLLKRSTGDVRMRLYLTELRSIKGESGSPVFVRFRQPPEQGPVPRPYSMALLGVLIGYWGDGAENLGIGQVVPAFRLHETLLQEDLMTEYDKAAQAAAEDEPVAETASAIEDETAELMSKLLQVPKEEADEVHRGHPKP